MTVTPSALDANELTVTVTMARPISEDLIGVEWWGRVFVVGGWDEPNVKDTFTKYSE